MKKGKENKKSKKGIIAVIIIVLLLLVIGVLCFFLFFGNKVTVNTNGGTIKSQLEMSDGEITKLPEIEKDGYKVTAYVDENKKVVKVGSKVTTKTQITPVYIKDEAETVKVTYMDGDKKIGELILEKNSELILFEDQTKDGFTFGGWLLENGMVLIGNPVVDRDLILKVNWIDNSKEYVTIYVMTAETEETIGSYKQEKGTKIKFPPTPTKDGYAFENWIYIEEASIITEDQIIDKDISIKPVWGKYNCPAECVRNADGKTCTKTSTADKVSKQGCPSGAFLYYGKCITLKGADSANLRLFDGYMTGKEVYYYNYCAKVVIKVTVVACPDGFAETEGTCKKAETINCTKEE